jgi:Shedu protein SduA, C-terminal
MRILFAHSDDADDDAGAFAGFGCAVETIELDELITERSFTVDIATCVDAIVMPLPDLASDEQIETDKEWRRLMDAALVRMVNLIELLRALPPQCAMPDGRRWSGVPVVIYGLFWWPSEVVDLFGIKDERSEKPHTKLEAKMVELRVGFDLLVTDDPVDRIWNLILNEVAAYETQLLAEFDGLGFMIIEDYGRFSVRAAVRHCSGASALYYGGADQRAGHLRAIARDGLGLDYEIDYFESLINRPDVDESQLQSFFVSHPYFLTMRYWSSAIAHPRFARDGPGSIVPDFVLTPLYAARQPRDSEWQLLELKRPQHRLLSGGADRRRLSAQVCAGLRQLRDYRDYFVDQRNRPEVARVLGQPIKRPQLGLLIGRDHDIDDVQTLDVEQDLQRVRIVTYDEILDRQRALRPRKR